MYTTIAYPTPFQTGGLIRSVVNLLYMGIWFNMLGDPRMGGGEKAIALLVALGLLTLVVNRTVASRFYSSIPAEGAPRIAIRVHDVLGTLGIFVIIAMLWIFRIVLDQLAGTSTSSWGSGGGSRVKDHQGGLYKKSFWTGNWEPEQGLFGQKTDRDMFGGPNLKQGFFGPVEHRAGFFQAPQFGSNGEKLYESSD